MDGDYSWKTALCVGTTLDGHAERRSTLLDPDLLGPTEDPQRRFFPWHWEVRRCSHHIVQLKIKIKTNIKIQKQIKFEIIEVKN